MTKCNSGSNVSQKKRISAEHKKRSEKCWQRDQLLTTSRSRVLFISWLCGRLSETFSSLSKGERALVIVIRSIQAERIPTSCNKCAKIRDYFPPAVSKIDFGSEKGPRRVWTSAPLTAKWYLCPLWNWVRVHAIGRGRAFTSPTFFHSVDTGAWVATSW